MAGLLLAGLGSAIGGAIGGTFLGISSAVIGQAIGAVVGSMIDAYLFAPTIKTSQEGPRLQEANVMTSVEGTNIVRGYGRFKVAGNVIWASRLREEVVKETTKQGGKGGGGGVETTTTTYNYYANFAVGLCEGPILDVHRVWADGKLVDLSEYTYRIYQGTESQTPDSLIETKEGVGNVPGYRGLAYIVFEDMLVNKFGNRIPQMQFEVTRPVHRSDGDAVGDIITGIDLIPGTTEFGYDPEVVEQVIYGGDSGTDIVERRVENAHSSDGKTDWEHALDQMEANLPNCNIVTFVVTWFGTDLRIGNCKIRPCVETRGKRTEPYSWSVAGLTRDTADLLPQIVYENGITGPAFGGTPTDVSVVRAIQDLKDRGFEVMFYPFILLDIEAGNSLPNPYSDNAADIGQAVYPWRGRITCSPAAGFAGSVDGTATAASQVASFLGTANASDFGGSGGTVTYSGPNEWSYRRFILHMAELCRQAGGVDYFCIGSEMVGATGIRGASNSFPFVTGLISLAAEVASLLPSAKLGYAADWSEYHSHRPTDGSGDVFFHLDPLWSDSNIDFIGIDNYLPISDWRDGDTHLDYLEGYDSIYDLDYLKSNIEGGEYYDWFYASMSDRINQVRTPITDGYGKPWVFRNKDIRNWWENYHFNRPGGVDSGDNKVPNPNGTGAVSGTGTLPTGWNQIDGAGLTRTIVGVGVEKGLPYVDIRFQGTITSGISAVSLQFNTGASQLAASQGDWREASLYVSLVGGTKAGVFRARIELSERNASGSGLVFTQGPDAWATIDRTPRRTSFNRQATHADCVGYLFRFQMEITSGQSVDFTIRIANPQFVNTGNATSWIPKSKPILFTEYGCPALNKATNQPNVFYDPKSSESFVPYFSSGGRDDEIQRQYIRATVEYWRDNSGGMIDTGRMCYWSYDARPWPTFPVDGQTWGDQPNWSYGHWISGRIDTVYVPDLLNELAEDYNITAKYDFSRAYGSCDGFVVSGKTSFRSTVEPLASLFMFDIIESGDMIKAVSRQEVQSRATVTLRDIAEAQGDNDEVVTLIRSQENELPVGMSIKFIDVFNDYEVSAVSQRRETTDAEAEPASETPIVIDYSRAQQIVDRLLYYAWASRTSAEFGLLPEYLFLEAGDVVTLDLDWLSKPIRIEAIADGPYRQMTGRSFDLGIFQPGGGSSRTQRGGADNTAVVPQVVFMDLPMLVSVAVPYRPYVAAYMRPFPGVNIYRSISDSNYALDTTMLGPSIIGRTTDTFDIGVTDVWDNTNELKVEIYSGELSSLPELNVLNGANALAIENSSGGWEIVQFVNATLTGTRRYTLTKLLRGQLGTEDGMEANLPAGARIVLLESTVQQLNMGIGDIGREYYLRYGPADRDIGHSTYQTVQKTFTGRGLRPYSPVHVKGVDDGAGNIIISWVRRTRINGDSWDYTDDVPLNEAFERYEVDVLDGSDTVVRTLTVTDATEVTYTAAQQVADGISTPFDVIVYQMSDQVGRGIGRRATING